MAVLECQVQQLQLERRVGGDSDSARYSGSQRASHEVPLHDVSNQPQRLLNCYRR
jgi:hypothetical protein